MWVGGPTKWRTQEVCEEKTPIGGSNLQEADSVPILAGSLEIETIARQCLTKPESVKPEKTPLGTIGTAISLDGTVRPTLSTARCRRQRSRRSPPR